MFFIIVRDVVGRFIICVCSVSFSIVIVVTITCCCIGIIDDITFVLVLCVFFDLINGSQKLFYLLFIYWGRKWGRRDRVKEEGDGRTLERRELRKQRR